MTRCTFKMPVCMGMAARGQCTCETSSQKLERVMFAARSYLEVTGKHFEEEGWTNVCSAAARDLQKALGDKS